MGKFRQYLAWREGLGLETGRKTDRSVLPVLEKIVRLLWERYNQETREFLQDIGKQDPEIKELLDRADRVKEPVDQPRSYVPDEMNPNVAQVVPPRSDMPSGMEQ